MEVGNWGGGAEGRKGQGNKKEESKEEVKVIRKRRWKGKWDDAGTWLGWSTVLRIRWARSTGSAGKSSEKEKS